MNRRMWAMALMSITVIGVLVGCTPSTDSNFSACGKECSNQEVNENGCDEGASDIASNNEVAVGDLSGTIAIRTADPSICKDLYWARFAPTEESSSAFDVTLKVNGTVVSVPGQPSDPEHPTLFAWTKGYQAFPGDKVEACVTPEGQAEICVEKTLP